MRQARLTKQDPCLPAVSVWGLEKGGEGGYGHIYNTLLNKKKGVEVKNIG